MVRIELPQGILERILKRLQAEQRLLNAKRRLVIFSVGFIGSLTAIIPTFKMIYNNLMESGFLHFFSLLFSDLEIVASYWQNFIMSLLETLPVFSLAIFLAVIFVFLESSRFLARDIKLVWNL